jgi:hypothetical protein
MKTTEIKYKHLSNCCGAKMLFCPPSFWYGWINVCSKCHSSLTDKEYTTTKEEIVTHIEIQKGIFRPVKNL